MLSADVWVRYIVSRYCNWTTLPQNNFCYSFAFHSRPSILSWGVDGIWVSAKQHSLFISEDRKSGSIIPEGVGKQRRWREGGMIRELQITILWLLFSSVLHNMRILNWGIDIHCQEALPPVSVATGWFATDICKYALGLWPYIRERALNEYQYLNTLPSHWILFLTS